VKLGPGVTDEADGLQKLRQVAGGPAVPETLLADPDLLVTAFVEQSAASQGHVDSLARTLASLHSARWRQWGGGSSWIGACPVHASEAESAAGFYGRRLLELARRCGLESPVSSVVARLDELLPAGGPALLHGDLWWGNVLWGRDGRAWLIDPSVHGGHPEEDIAMLALFGAVPDSFIEVYSDIRALQAGWRERIPLFQLYPLLVHTVLFGGSYGLRAEAIARRFG
jgi:fructosamine-3-kinase